MKIDKNRMIVTIESEPGSRGEEIAHELSRMIGVPCYGKEILDVAAQISGISAKLLHRYDGRTVYAAYDLTAEDEASIKIPPARDFITAQVVACKRISEDGPCILVDRHASAALADNENQISIFIHADFESRAREYALEKGLDMAEAEKLLKKTDRAYHSYYAGNNRNWGRADQYDFCINASACEPDKLAGVIAAFLEDAVGQTLMTRAQQNAM